MEYTRQEFMAIATGRELKDGELAIFGVGLSMLAGYFAKKCHAPNLKPFTEGGIYGSTPVGGLPWGIECNRLSVNATSFTGAIDALGFLVASGRADVGIIGAAQIDKYGNVNTTGIWDVPPWKVGKYIPPRIRLNGSGGANDIAVGCKRFLVMAAHEKKRFSEKVARVSHRIRLQGKVQFSRRRSLGHHHDPGYSETGSGEQGVLPGRLLPLRHR
jgi:glutaconate CoA-transferase subunit B